MRIVPHFENQIQKEIQRKQMRQMTNYAGSHMLCCSNVSEWLIIPHEGAEYNEKRNIMMKMNNLWI